MERAQWPMAKNESGMALLARNGIERTALVYRNVIGLVALDFVLRFVFTGAVRVAFVVKVLLVHLGDVAADVAGFGIPGDVVTHFET